MMGPGTHLPTMSGDYVNICGTELRLTEIADAEVLPVKWHERYALIKVSIVEPEGAAVFIRAPMTEAEFQVDRIRRLLDA